jgi:chromate transport protein ChrA
MTIQTFFQSFTENPSKFGFLLILIGSILVFGFVILTFSTLFSGFDDDMFNQKIYPITSIVAGIILGLLSLFCRKQLKSNAKRMRYKNSLIILGTMMIVFSYFVPGILLIVGTLILYYDKK